MPTAVTEPAAPAATRYHLPPAGCGYRFGSPAHRWVCLGEPLPEPLAPEEDPAEEPGTAEDAPEEPEPAQARLNTTEVRAWAKRTGRAVKDRGRIPAELAAAYLAAHA